MFRSLSVLVNSDLSFVRAGSTRVSKHQRGSVFENFAFLLSKCAIDQVVKQNLSVPKKWFILLPLFEQIFTQAEMSNSDYTVLPLILSFLPRVR